MIKRERKQAQRIRQRRGAPQIAASGAPLQELRACFAIEGVELELNGGARPIRPSRRNQDARPRTERDRQEGRAS